MSAMGSAENKKRVLLVDDHEVFAQGLANLLKSEEDLTVIGWASDGRAAVAAVREGRPDVVVTDLSMTGLNGIEATRQIVALGSEAKVVCLSVHAEPRFVEEALAAGASAYVLKEDAFEEVTRAIRAVLAGRMYLCSGVAGTVVGSWKSRHHSSAQSAYGLLSERERQVLQLLAEGRSTPQIGEHLHISAKTVGTHREHIMQKTGLHSIAELTRYAVGEGLADLSVKPRRTH